MEIKLEDLEFSFDALNDNHAVLKAMQILIALGVDIEIPGTRNDVAKMDVSNKPKGESG